MPIQSDRKSHTHTHTSLHLINNLEDIDMALISGINLDVETS